MNFTTFKAVPLLAALACSVAVAAPAPAPTPSATQVFWGDTHLHTSVSTDAAARGNRLGLDAAYRFARGEAVTSSSGLQAQLQRPLDFMVVADHSDGMGFFGLLARGEPIIMAEEKGRRWHELLKQGQGGVVSREVVGEFSQGTLPWKTNDPSLMAPVWQANLEAAERFNEPGVFTALIGYEWTSLIKGNNLHRVVILRDGADRAGQMLPYTLADSADPEDLWQYLDKYETSTGGAAMAIPHNANLSNGMMFAPTRLSGEAFDKDYARRRARWEPLLEISQIKGDSETHPLLSPDDEFADFGTWDVGNLDMSEAKTPDMLQYEYARAALKRGLAQEARLGANPFAFGVIASTDSHTSLATADDDNFFGKHPGAEPSAGRASGAHRSGKAGQLLGWEQLASGYAAVWATGNTREALFDALQRRETYGTTGPRITVRFFGGWGFEQADARAADMAAIGYAKGVPMGGKLKPEATELSPSFLIAADKDPAGANLDRVQIIKGWLDDRGQTRERAYDVAWSGDRIPGKDGRLPPVGNTVDINRATWSDTIGAPQLSTVWQDPDFDPAQPAFYYLRVLEIPTPRWPAYDAVRFKTGLSEGIRAIDQQRAYTSPIWYTPES